MLVMSDDEIEESWTEFFENNHVIPPHHSRGSQNDKGAQIFPFCLNLKSLELSFASKTESDFQLQLTFYDAANHCFFGSTWIGAIVKSQIASNGVHVLSLNEPLYFHTSVNDYTTVAVVELVNTSGNVFEGVGWAWIRVFSQYESLTDTGETALPQNKRVEFYHGSPMALLHISEPVEEYLHLKKLNNCTLHYTLQTHEVLEKIAFLLPESVFLSGDDFVPGVAEEGEQDDGLIDILKSPVPIKCWPCHLNKLCINLLPSVDKFEEQLCELLQQDRLVKDLVTADGSVITICERRLKVGVHNGWKFVKSPHITYLEKEYPNTMSMKSKKQSLRPGSTNSTKECSGLILTSRLELNEMIKHPLFAIVFQLQYVVNVPVIQPEIPTGRRARSKFGSSFGSMPLAKKVEIALRSVIWVPFENGKMNKSNIALELNGGVGPNPFGDMVFAEMYEFLEDLHFDSLGKISFDFIQPKLKKAQDVSPNRYLAPLEQPFYRSYSTPTTDERSIYTDTDINQISSIGNKPPIPPAFQQSQMLTPRYVQQVQHLTELPRTQQYTPLIVSAMETPKPVALSRVAHSLLHTVEYPRITDTQGNHPFIVDPQEIVKYDIARENRDPLHANEIILQFLAASRCGHRTAFFTFQFYRFPQTTTERLHLKKLDGADRVHGDIPFILQKSTRDGKISTHSPPGLMIKYTVDPSFLQPGEKTSFLKYLLQQRLYIDMWDGDSLLLIGSTSIALKDLLRQGKPAVQVSEELDVVFMEYSEDNPTLAGDVLQTGLIQPPGVKISLEAKLFLRLANIGCLPDTNSEKLQQLPPSFNSTVVVPSAPMLTSSRNPSSQQFKKAATSTAKLVSDCDAELATVLLTRKDVPGKTKKMKENEANLIRKRKMERMQAIRQLTGGEEIPSPFILQKEEKIQRTRDLRTIQLYREKYKSNNILSILEENITTHHMIHSSLGHAEFFEFAVKNPYPNDHVVMITLDDKELQVVVNPQEWRYLKQQTETNTAIEEQMFTSSTEAGTKLFIRANETVHVPFKFQSFTSQHIAPEMGPSHPLYTKSNDYSLQTFGKDTTLSSKDIKVLFHGNESKTLAILILHVELHPHTINQTFRFYQPEQTFLKKAIRLPPWHTLPGSSVLTDGTPPRVVAKCSDDGAICETHQVRVGEPHEVFIKVPCGISPSVNRFFILVFIDKYCTKPCQIWQFYVHSLQRVDINATEGQSSKLSILLKGTQSSRMVKCFSSNPDELKVAPQDHFMLMSNGVQELCFTLRPLASGKRMMFVNVVDQEFHQLVKSWLVMTTCSPPVITKSFEVNLRVGGGAGSNKKISFLNPYPVKKNFYFKANRDDLVQFKEDGVLLGGGETHNIGLSFLPQQSEGSTTVLIFINDRDGKNEETFCVKVTYTSDDNR